MSIQRRIEVFSAGCAFCNEVIDAVRREADASCEVIVRSTMDSRVLARAEQLGIRSVPAVVIDGKVADSCTASGVVELLKNAGLGKAQPSQPEADSALDLANLSAFDESH
jgi:hypothetical protein